MTITTRPATEADIDAIYEISCTVHQGDIYRELIPRDSYKEFVSFYEFNKSNQKRYQQKIQRYLRDPSWYLWVAMSGNEIIGFTMAHDAGNDLKLRGLFIKEDYQGRGAGRQLFDASCAVAKSGRPISFYVMENNARAITMYLRSGFEFVDGAEEPFYGTKLLKMMKQP